MRNLMWPAGIARQHDARDCLSRAGLVASRCHAATRSDGCTDALIVGLMRKMRELQIGIALAGRLEAHHAGK